MTLHDLRFFTDTCPHGYPALRDAFRLGYETRLPWPERHAGQVDTLIAGRRLRTANYRILQHEAAPNVLIPLFERLEAEFRALLEGPP